MSGSLWRIVFDPVIRALVELTKDVGSLSAFAGDIGVSVGGIISALLILVPVLVPIEAAICLKLNWKRAHIVNFPGFSIFKFKKQIGEAVPLALGAEICYFARYLGFLVGPCARAHAWEAPCRKLLERARHIQTLGLSLNGAILAFGVFAFSVIRFSLQFVPISLVLIWNFGLALDICTPTPRYSLGVSALCSFRRLGMPIEVPDLPSTSRATMYRVANASEVLETLYGEVCATRGSDLAVFCPRHQPWIDESSVFELMKLKEELSLVPGVSDLSGRGVQWGVMKILRGALGGHELHDTIRRRLQYFGIDRAWERAEVFFFNMALISSYVKPFVLANIIKTICNAHSTARRFPKSGSHSACRFGCFAVGGDCVLHCPFCPVVLSFISENLGGLLLSGLLWVVNSSVPHFFLLERVFIGDLVRTAIWCDIISHSFNTRRAAIATAASPNGWLSSSKDTLRSRMGTDFHQSSVC